MNNIVKAFLSGALLTIYLRFGLEPTGWLFYEASFFLGVDGLYWGYSIFRGGAHAMSLWSLQNIFCIGLGLLLAMWKLRKVVSNNKAVSNSNMVANKTNES